jgi:hypothetical protein
MDALVRLRRRFPSCPRTAEALEALRANEDNVDANSLGEMISGDPLMTLKVLAYESGHRGRRVVTSAETVISALVMMGISPFFRAFGPQQTIDERLNGRPEARQGLERVLQRAHHGANFALAFAVHRTDRTRQSSMPPRCSTSSRKCCSGATRPTSRRRCRRCSTPIRTCARARRNARCSTSSSPSFQRALAEAWGLPALVVESTAEAKATGQTSARIVALAARLARHTARGWDNAACPTDLSEIAALLNLSPERR